METVQTTLNWRPGGVGGAPRPEAGTEMLVMYSLGKPYTQDYDAALVEIGASGVLYQKHSELPSRITWEQVNRWVPLRELHNRSPLADHARRRESDPEAAKRMTPPWTVVETDYGKFGGQREWEVRDQGVACIRCESEAQAAHVCACLNALGSLEQPALWMHQLTEFLQLLGSYPPATWTGHGNPVLLARLALAALQAPAAEAP